MSEFGPAVEAVLAAERGYSNDPHDSGGETNFGIAKRYHPDVDIKALTREEAIEIYRREYWEPSGLAAIRDQAVATKMFVLAVNMPSKQANRCLQRAVRATGHAPLEEDGYLGKQTLTAVNAANPAALLAALRSEAAAYYRTLGNPRFLRGWENRAYS